MRLGLIGGAGREGRGLALRWARAGHAVTIGSRVVERARERAEELAQEALAQGALARAGAAAGSASSIQGADNHTAVREADVAVLCVPYAAHRATLLDLQPVLAGKILIDVTVPLAPPRVREVHLPAGGAAALEARDLLGDQVRVVAALHHLSWTHLADLAHVIDCDALLCTNDAEAREVALALVGDLGVRALDAGPLRNAVALEALTPVLLHLNRRYGGNGAGLRITGIPGGLPGETPGSIPAGIPDDTAG